MEDFKGTGAKRKSDKNEEDCMTTIGKIPKIDRNFDATSSLLEKLSRGEKIDLDNLDGIGEGEPKIRTRTTSEYAPTRINLQKQSSFCDKMRSLPTTPTFPAARKRNLSLSSDSTISHRSLLGSFTENALTGRLEPVKILDGFCLQLTASGSQFSSEHLNLPVTVYYFDLNTTGCQFFPAAPVPYLGKCDLLSEYRIPSKGHLQATLFNPQKTVIKMFLTSYDLEKMPANSKSFIRHIWEWKVENSEKSKHLQYLIHYRLQSDRKSRVFLHSDIRILFSQDSTRDALLLPNSNTVNNYQLIDRIEIPKIP
ncbi:unnamed protein product [Caenorhabditis angaria]|uniref:Atos-like conserved domain-containing protein n=1 Tax=Caenorhabditis angaria TaxID=860376 RepID=A0A9P1I494_9PELO|nr:unnamed protein product [Caenorhabditis angaria]